MIKIFLIIFVICLVYYFKKNKIHVKWKTFTKKSFRPERGDFGVYCYCGKQGTGKTYSVVEYLIDNYKNCTIFANIKGIRHIEYEFFVGFKGMLDIKDRIDNGDIKTDKQIVIVFDELVCQEQELEPGLVVELVT